MAALGSRPRAALLFGGRVWPGIWIGAALANITVEASFFATALIASGNTLEALAAQALIRRYVGDPGAFRRGEDVVKFILLCALSAAIAPSIAALALAAGHTLEGFRNWWTWWQGDATGMIIVAPLVLSWCARDDAAWPRERSWKRRASDCCLPHACAISADRRPRTLRPFPDVRQLAVHPLGGTALRPARGGER
jgi:integral membrane sensor domain MASE1